MRVPVSGERTNEPWCSRQWDVIQPERKELSGHTKTSRHRKFTSLSGRSWSERLRPTGCFAKDKTVETGKGPVVARAQGRDEEVENGIFQLMKLLCTTLCICQKP